jgi:hypothetical protein
VKVAARGVLVSFLAWTAGGVVALGVGQLALSQLAEGLAGSAFQSLTPDGPLPDEALPDEALPAGTLPEGTVSEAPAGPPSPPPGPADGPSPGPSATSVGGKTASSATPTGTYRDAAVSSPGGTAIVRCRDGIAYLVTWSPNPDYRVDEVHRGPAATVNVKFESQRHKVDLSARCVGGVAQGHFESESDE